MPPIKTSLPSSREFRHVTSQFDYRFICIYFILDMLDEMKYMCAPWHPAISWKIGPWVCWAVDKNKNKPGIASFCVSATYTSFQFGAVTLKPPVVSLTARNNLFQLRTPISHRIDGPNYSTIRTIWVTGYTTNFENEATLYTQAFGPSLSVVFFCMSFFQPRGRPSTRSSL